MPNTNCAFVSVHSRSALEREIEMTETLLENGADTFDGLTPAEAYMAALKFVMNQQGSIVRSDFEDLMDA